MESEFARQLKALKLNETDQNKILAILNSTDKEFPCLSCPSKDDCSSFRWFTKLFGNGAVSE